MPTNQSKYGMKEASRTTATVLIDTHDRGHDFGGQRLNISEYITQITIDVHIAGGGSANISLPAVDHFEDIIASGDLVNIYFDTHRDNDNIYNKGNVRTFFGFVDSVSKSISVGGDGAKLTMYTIICQDFGKAIRSTEIYNNPFLSQQHGEGKPDIVREDLAHNLGGLTLFAHGIAYDGTPRDVVFQNLMRCVGMGGQWILPQHYSEGLPGSQHNVSFSVQKASDYSDLVETVAGEIAGSIDDGYLAMEVDQLLQNPNLNTSEMEHILKGIEELSGASTIEFNASINTETKKVKIPHRSYISNTFFKIGPAQGYDSDGESIFTSIDTKLKPALEQIIIKVSHESRSVSDKFRLTPLINHLADPAVKDEDIVQPAISIFNILCFDYMEDVDGYWANWRWMHYQGNLHGALMDGSNPICNEFFFDLRPAPTFDNEAKKDGLGIKTNGALPMVPAVILREKPFTNYPPPTKEILNVNEKNSIQIGGLKVGKDSVVGLKDIPPEPITERTKPYKKKKTFDDQLFMSSISPTGGLTELDETDIGSVKGLIDSEVVGSFVTDITQTDIPWIGAYNLKLDALIQDGTFAVLSHLTGGLAGFEEFVESFPTEEFWLQDLATTLNVTQEEADQLLLIQEILVGLSPAERTALKAIVDAKVGIKEKLVAGGLNQQIVSQKFSNVVSLPRPVFRSPDGTRITQERQIAVSRNILGTIVKKEDGSDLVFTAFSSAGKDTGVELSGYYPVHGSEGDLYTPAQTPYLLTAPGSELGTVKTTLEKAKKTRWHCLDFMTIYPHEIMVETQYRGDSNIINFIELTGSLEVPSIEAQRFTLNNSIPLITPVSVHRFGVRVKAIQTKFLDILNLGGSSASTGDKSYEWSISLLMRWNVLLDMWNQHNHEYISTNLSVRGMPGLRPGYRIDRPDLNLSFYVDRVSHTWTYPGMFITQISASRGQPTAGFKEEKGLDGEKKKVSKILPYYPPEPNVNSNKQERQKLGQLFSVGDTLKGKIKASPGTYTGQYLRTKVKGRDDTNKQFPVPPQGDAGDNQLPE